MTQIQSNLVMGKPEGTADSASNLTAWETTVRSGLRLLIWTAIVEILLANLIGAAIPLICAALDVMELSADLFHMCVPPIPAVAGVFLLVAIVRLTKRDPTRLASSGIDILRGSVRVVVAMDLLVRLVRVFVGPSTLVFASMYLTYSFCIALLFLYVRRLALRFGREKLARHAVCIGVAMVLLPDMIQPMMPILGRWITIPNYTQTLVPLMFEGGLCVVGISVLWRLSSRMNRATERQCVCCSYDLTGNESGVRDED